jgi:NADH-quinone oxidoreductase subunit J
VVLIIFSIFLTQQSGKEMPKPGWKRITFSLLAVLFGLAGIGQLIAEHGFNEVEKGPFQVAVGEIGTQMLSTTEHGFILPFEVVSMLLLAAMIGCIVIAMKNKEKTVANTTENK